MNSNRLPHSSDEAARFLGDSCWTLRILAIENAILIVSVDFVWFFGYLLQVQNL